jgi:hypothetical protein
MLAQNTRFGVRYVPSDIGFSPRWRFLGHFVEKKTNFFRIDSQNAFPNKANESRLACSISMVLKLRYLVFYLVKSIFKRITPVYFKGYSKTRHFRDILLLQKQINTLLFLNLMITSTDSYPRDNVWYFSAQSLIRIEKWKRDSVFTTSTIRDNSKIFYRDRCQWFIVFAS